MHDIGRGLCWALDAVPFAEDRLGFVPDGWQAQLLRSRSQSILLNCCRQSGKSTTTAIVALHQAIYGLAAAAVHALATPPGFEPFIDRQSTFTA